MKSPTEAIRIFGLLGLIPFAGPGLMVLMWPETEWALKALQLYAFGIIAYLTGTWWLNPKSSHGSAALLGHALFLVAFFSLLLWPAGFLFLAALILVAIYLIEYRTELAGRFDPDYQRTRRLLTFVAVLSLFSGQIGLLGVW